MAKLIKIIRCTYCRSDDIDTDSKTYFKCKLCGYAWQVIDEEDKKQSAKDEKDLPEKQNKNKKQ